MNKFKFYLALYIAKLCKIALKILNKNATYMPGKIALKICPEFLKYIGKPEKIIGVTGTNGKTTVSNMIIDALECSGYNSLVTNKLGSNINAGIATSLLIDSNLKGEAKSKIGVFEIDERSSVKIYPYVKPDILVCTNLFRDSIKRNAHTEYIFNIINSNLPENTKLILNADDLISSSLGKVNQEKVYYGIEKQSTDVVKCENIIQDIRTCPICNDTLAWDYLRYHHIGKAHCPSCDFKSKTPDFVVKNIDKEKNEILVNIKGEDFKFNALATNILNVYNMIAAITVLKEFGLSCEQIAASFNKIDVVKTRFNEEKIGNIDVIMHLAKGQNPVACSIVFNYIKHETGNKAVLLNLDDFFDAKEGSENLTWIYDTDYEFLNDDSIKQIIIGGVRCEDHLLRLLLAGVPREKIQYATNEVEAAKLLNLDGIDKVYITYDVYTVHIANAVKEEVRKNILSKETKEEEK